MVVDDRQHLAPNLVDGVLFGLLKLLRGVLIIPSEDSVLFVQGAHQLGALVLVEHLILGLQLVLQIGDFAL